MAPSHLQMTSSINFRVKLSKTLRRWNMPFTTNSLPDGSWGGTTPTSLLSRWNL